MRRRRDPDTPSRRILVRYLARINTPEIIRRYKAGDGAYVIAASIGIGPDAVYGILRKHGVRIRSELRFKGAKKTTHCKICSKPALPQNAVCGYHRKIQVAEAARNYWRRKHWSMAKRKRFNKEQLVKELARERVGPVKPKRVIQPKNKRKPRHKETIWE